MRFRAPATDRRDEAITELEPLLRRVVGARVRDPDTVDDLVQEALARVIAVRGRLDDEAVTPYAIVTARNLVTSLARERDRSRRHQPRLVDLSEPERPEDAALRREEAAAVEAALADLPDHEREAVVAHEVEGVDTATLAEARRSTPARSGSSCPDPGPAAPRLPAGPAPGRAADPALPAGAAGPVRGRPAPPARPGRRRPPDAVPDLRLAEPAAGRAPPLDRGAAAAAGHVVAVAAAPGLGAAPAGPGLADGVGGRRDRAGAGTAARRTRPGAATRADHDHRAARGGAPGGGGGGSGVRLVVPGRSLLPVPGREVLARHAGQRVRGEHVPARGVYADEGFWVGTSDGDQLWVQLIGRGESPFRVRAGQRASFTGRLVPNPPGFAERVGMVPEEGADLAGRQGHHIEVAYGDITLEP